MTIAVANQAISSAVTQALDAGGAAGGAAQPGGADKFQALMNTAHLAPPASAAGPDTGLKQVQEIVAKHDAAAEKVMGDMKNFSDNITSMNPLEAIGESSRISLQLATVNFDFQAKMGIVDASKSAAETLMKNQ
jgi:type III secretion inner rod protein HrpB2